MQQFGFAEFGFAEFGGFFPEILSNFSQLLSSLSIHILSGKISPSFFSGSSLGFTSCVFS